MELEDKIRCNELLKEKHSNWLGLSNQKAIRSMLEELDRLQKENEELTTKLKEIEDEDLDIANLRAEAMLDMDKIWRNKIREKIEELKENEEGYAMELQAKIDVLNGLLKEE